MKKKHLALYSLTIVTFLSLILIFNFDNIRQYLRDNLSSNAKIIIKRILLGEKYLNEVNFYRKINYNQKIIPETQFVKINFQKILLNELLEFSDTHYNKAVLGNKVITKKFFIDTSEERLIISNVKGEIYFSKFADIGNLSKIDSNLKSYGIYDVLDIAVANNYLFVSSTFKKNENDECTFFQILYSRIDYSKLEFKDFFKTDNCLKNTLGGRIVKFDENLTKGILVTLGASGTEGFLAQKDDSVYGKILFFNIETKKYKIFSKGHRNPQGLIIDGENILSTEHGAYGGDEINKIIFQKNYGFPVVSYGDSYEFKNNYDKDLDYRFKKDHKKFGFKEPIFSFVPSIGISELVRIPNNFTKYWQNNYFVSSLNGRSIFRIKMDENFEKVIYLEKIPIGERIRDIKFLPKINSFILALEETGSLGVIKIE
tara:strand:- start:4591 stop:5874 length:1284 start_codon:yes stop_codon:yes gene_type:complete